MDESEKSCHRTCEYKTIENGEQKKRLCQDVAATRDHICVHVIKRHSHPLSYQGRLLSSVSVVSTFSKHSHSRS